MHRPIKFRAWRADKNKMLVGEDIYLEDSPIRITLDGKSIFRDNDHGCNDPDCCGGRSEFDTYAKVILMQFTGLHDKNGKEIFEGDIVQFHFNKDWCEGDYLPKERFEVSLEKFGLWCKGENFGYEGELLLQPSGCEVLGNIYENPGLL